MKKSPQLFYCVFTIFIISINLSLSAFSFPGKQIPILPDDTVVELTDLNIHKISAAVQIGKRLVIKLKGNLDSGYGWYYSNALDDPTNILIPQNLNSFKSGEFISTINDQGCIINDGFYYFIFKTKSLGKVFLNFAYRRPYEFLSRKDRVLAVSVRVMRDFFCETNALLGEKDGRNNFKNRKWFERNG